MPFQLSDRYWWGPILACLIGSAIIYLFIWALLEPIGIPEEIEIPQGLLKSRAFFHIILSLVLGAGLIAYYELDFRKRHWKTLQAPALVGPQPDDWYRNGRMLPLICFDVIIRNLSEEDARALGNFSHILRESLLKVLGKENLDWSASNRGFSWVVVSEDNKPKDLVDLAEYMFCRVGDFNREKRHLEHAIQLRAALHYVNVYSVRGMSEHIRWELFSQGVDLAIDLAKLGSDEHLLCTENIGRLLSGDKKYRHITHQLPGKYRVNKAELVLFNLYGERFGNPQEPKVGQVYPLWRTRLAELLEKANIRPSRDIQNFLLDIGEDTFAIDDVISLVESPGFQGWDDPDELDVRRVDTPITEFPANWDQLKAEYGELEKHEMDWPKLFIDEWDPYIIDQGGKLHISLCESSYSPNKALETLLKEEVPIRLKGKMTTLREFYRGRDEDGRSYFWTYLPNMIIMTPVVITADKKFIAMRRSATVSYYKRHWSITLEEQINPKGDSPPERTDNYSLVFFNAIRRGVYEELGDMVQIESIKLLGLHREYPNGNVNVTAVVQISQNAEVVHNSWVRANDRHEGTNFDYKPFTPEVVAQTLARSTYLPDTSESINEDKFHGGSRYRLLMAALAEFDHGEFITVLRQVAR